MGRSNAGQGGDCHHLMGRQVVHNQRRQRRQMDAPRPHTKGGRTLQHRHKRRKAGHAQRRNDRRSVAMLRPKQHGDAHAGMEPTHERRRNSRRRPEHQPAPALHQAEPKLRGTHHSARTDNDMDKVYAQNPAQLLGYRILLRARHRRHAACAGGTDNDMLGRNARGIVDKRRVACTDAGVPRPHNRPGKCCRKQG